MREKVIFVCFICLLILFVPFIITMVWSKQEAITALGQQKDLKVMVSQNGQTVTLSEEDYIKGVLAASMPLNFEEETLQAQAIIIRTKIYEAYLQAGRIVRGDQLDLTYVTESELKSNTDSKRYKAYMKKLDEVVEKTEHQILTYEQKPIEAVYHYCNAGQTRSYEQVYGKRKPYLVSVSSKEDVKSEVAITVKKFNKADLIALIKEQLGIGTLKEENLMSQITISKQDPQGYVLLLKVGDSNVSGEDFKEALSLNSCNFAIQESGGIVQVVVKGKGIGIGFSQFGANEKVKEGSSCKQVLQYYYKNVKIENYSLN